MAWTHKPELRKEICADDDQANHSLRALPSQLAGDDGLCHVLELVAPSPRQEDSMLTVRHTARYARYLLSSLATVAFLLGFN